MSRADYRDHGPATSSAVMSKLPLNVQPINKVMVHNVPSGRRSASPPPMTISTSPSSEQPSHPEHATGSPSTERSARGDSPRSMGSDVSQTPPAVQRPPRGCRFETGMAQARRRVPYSLGPEKLPVETQELKRTIGVSEAQSLTSTMQNLYAKLLPSTDSEDRRKRFVQKLEALLQARWPGKVIQVSIFGSTGNCLGTSESDIDICITTDCKEIEHVCLIADLLAKNGMQRVVCVSSAKVPIVKAWDPELQVACDMNVNNPVALENTHMIRSYIQIDHRVRPLAMIVKYWAKRRMLNDAALGGTLSSYTWICMVLNFLQTRQPPVLPSLQQRSGLQSIVVGGVDVSFDKNLDVYRDFGIKNESSLGDLLFQFFKYFGHEFDYEGKVLSVRLGAVISKSQKSWHLLQDNRLCVEEPFNTTRNLANTADDTSMRGIHLELRRAFDLIVTGDLEGSCEQYVSRPEEHRQTATFIPPTSSRPTISQAPSQPPTQTSRNNRSLRGPRNGNRNSAPRRSSNTANRTPHYLHDLPFQMTPQELQLQQQHQQHLLHDQLFQQYQYLQLQEQELRMQLYQQSMRQRGMVPGQAYTQGAVTRDAIRMPITSMHVQSRFGHSSPFLSTASPVTGIVTNPASPLLGNVLPEGRRYTRSTSVAASIPPTSMRAHSQPARTMSTANGYQHHQRVGNDFAIDRTNGLHRRPSISSYMSGTTLGHWSQSAVSSASTLYDAGRRPVEFVGFYVGQSPLLSAHPQSTTISPIPSNVGLAIHKGGLSPHLSSHPSVVPSGQSSPAYRNSTMDQNTGRPSVNDAVDPPVSSPTADGPLVIDGSLKSAKRRRQAARNGHTASNEHAHNIARLNKLDLGAPAVSEDNLQPHASQNTRPDEDLPQSQDMNGLRHATGQVYVDATSFNPPHGVPTSAAPSVPYLESPDQQSVSHDASSSPPANHALRNPGDAALSTKLRNTKGMKAPAAAGAGTATQALASKTNGQNVGDTPTAAVKATDTPAGWQVPKKKSKKARKAVRSENDAAVTNSAGGELLPLDEALRKGG